MKCVKKFGDSAEVVRVSNQKAKEMVTSGKWHYTNKSAWKANGRKRG